MEIVDNDYFLSFIRELLGTGSNWFRTEPNHLEPQPVVLVVVLKVWNRTTGCGFGSHDLFQNRTKPDRGSTMKRESDEMRGARLQREREMEKFQPPGWNSKTKVFIWETMGGHQIRRKVTTAFADRMWDEFDKATMRHNAFRNEWDLWTVHDPSRPCPIDDEEGEDDANSNLESLNDNLQALLHSRCTRNHRLSSCKAPEHRGRPGSV